MTCEPTALEGGERRLLCATTSYPLERGQSAGRFVAHLNALYAELGFTPEVLCPRSVAAQGAAQGAAPAQGAAQGSLRCPYYGFSLTAAPSFGGLLSGAGAPDYLQAHPIKALALAPLNLASLTLSARRARAQHPESARVAHWLLPSIITLGHAHLAHAHGGDVALLERLPMSAQLARELVRRVNALNFVSLDLKARFEALLGDELSALGVQATVLPMGVEEPAPSEPFKRELSARRSAPLLLATVGRLTPIKGLDVLIEALASLPSELSDQIELFVAGEGPEELRLTLLARERGVKLTLLGHLSPSERDALLCEADLFVLPSRALGRRVEGSPVALMEALSLGCPVVATTAGGVSALLAQAPQALKGLVRGCVPNDPQRLATELNATLKLLSPLSLEERATLRAELSLFGGRWRWSELKTPHQEALLSALKPLNLSP